MADLAARVARRSRLRAHIDQVFDDGYVIDDEGAERPISPSGIELEFGQLLRDLVVHEEAARTIEVGLALGLSTLFICDGLLGATAEAIAHTAVDPLERIVFGNAGLRSLDQAGVLDLVTHVDLTSDLALPQLLHDERGQFDFAFVDGAHWFDYAFLDSFFCYQLVKPGGLVVIDDTWMPGPGLAARYLVSNLGCEELDLQPTAGTARAGRLEQAWPRLTALRTPAEPLVRAADHFVSFCEEVSPPSTRAAGLIRRGGRRARQLLHR